MQKSSSIDQVRWNGTLGRFEPLATTSARAHLSQPFLPRGIHHRSWSLNCIAFDEMRVCGWGKDISNVVRDDDDAVALQRGTAHAGERALRSPRTRCSCRRWRL
jgi:hypothetical protein